MANFVILAIVCIAVFLIVRRLRKLPKHSHLVLTTGELKTGKTMVSVYMAVRTYKKRRLLYKIKCKLFPFWVARWEEPLLYSNIHLAGVEYVALTNDLLQRKARFNYGSVVLISESSLVADSQLVYDGLLNEQLLLFVKLFCHETKNGVVFYDTQNVYDNHYSIKRCLSTYIHLYESIKLPFFVLLKYRYLEHSEDGTVINTKEVGDKFDDSYDWCLVPKSVWKMYDRFCYSAFTDDLPVENKKQFHKKKKMFCKSNIPKSGDIVSFRRWKNLNTKKESEGDEGEKNI